MIQANKSDKIYLEIFLDCSDKLMVFPWESQFISEKDLQMYSIYLRITSIDRVTITNEKFAFNDICRLEDYNKGKQICLIDLVNMGHQIKERLIHKRTSRRVSSLSLSKNFADSLINVYLSRNNLNKDIGNQMQLSSSSTFAFENKWILIYRGVFTVKPKQMLFVTINARKKKMCFVVYNLKICKKFSKIYSFSQLASRIPFLNSMIVNFSMYRLIGMRVKDAFKNSLMIDSYINIC